MLFSRESADGGRQIQLKNWKLALSSLPDPSPATYLASPHTSVHVAFLALALLLVLRKHHLPPSSGLCKRYSFCLEHSSLHSHLHLIYS